MPLTFVLFVGLLGFVAIGAVVSRIARLAADRRGDPHPQLPSAIVVSDPDER